MTDRDRVRTWCKGKPNDDYTRAKCSAALGIPMKLVWEALQPVEKRRAYFREHKRKYLSDPENRRRHRESVARYAARARAKARAVREAFYETRGGNR